MRRLLVAEIRGNSAFLMMRFPAKFRVSENNLCNKLPARTRPPLHFEPKIQQSAACFSARFLSAEFPRPDGQSPAGAGSARRKAAANKSPPAARDTKRKQPLHQIGRA